MVVYLDQNKWIELARMFHRKDVTPRAQQILHCFEAASTGARATFPLSSVHYVETARISNAGRKVRLGEAMWHFSRGVTLVAYSTIVRHELEQALSMHLPQVVPRAVSVLGKGHAHAFGTPPLSGGLAAFADEVERSLLTGNRRIGIQPPAFSGTKQRETFKEHLATLHARFQDVAPELRENWLYAMSTLDILNPLNDVAARHNLPHSALEGLGETRLKQIIDAMPTRRVDMHLHRQVLKNRAYVAKASDLEDWGGLAVASCYCDVVVCEKHMASMLRRNRFSTQARVETSLDAALPAA
jgi:hypothetical protein